MPAAAIAAAVVEGSVDFEELLQVLRGQWQH